MTKTKGQANNGASNGFNVEGYEAISAQGQEAFEAVKEASTIASEGYMALGQAWFNLARTSMEQSAAATKAMIAARNPTEFLAVQSEYAKNAAEQYVAESKKIGEMAFKVANDTATPLKVRAEKIAGQYTKHTA